MKTIKTYQYYLKTNKTIQKQLGNIITQKCSNCKELVKEKLTLKNRVFDCWNCSMELDRDINSARNILDKAIENNGFGVNLCRVADGSAMKQKICNLV